jgi:hypothetical protein
MDTGYALPLLTPDEAARFGFIVEQTLRADIAKKPVDAALVAKGNRIIENARARAAK